MKTQLDELKTLIENTAHAVKRIGADHLYRGNGFENWAGQCGYTAFASVRWFEDGKQLSKSEGAFLDYITERAGYHYGTKFKPVSWRGLELIDKVLADALVTFRYMNAEQLELA